MPYDGLPTGIEPQGFTEQQENSKSKSDTGAKSGDCYSDGPKPCPRLPVELMSQIYGCTFSPYLNAAIHNRDFTLIKTESGFHTLAETDCKEAMDFMLVNTEHNEKFSAYLNRHAPVHVSLVTKLTPVDDSSFHLTIRSVDNILPTMARQLYISTEIETPDESFANPEDTSKFEWEGDVLTPWPVDSLAEEDIMANEIFAQAFRKHLGKELPEDVCMTVTHSEEEESIVQQVDRRTQFDITTSPTFVELKKRLQGCVDTEDIFLVFDNVGGGSLSGEDESGGEFDGMVFKELVTAVEQIARVKRYAVHVGRYGMFASRKAGHMWISPEVLRIDRDVPWWRFNEEYYELLRDLHIQ
ncbi:hypothetical protein CB0940_04287 [Cercospora beticola]|uniref:Uncharacterized protein n=1 Tax=Cercospora beticola TaxID=122368 RepID=A0A2G5HJ76_CERBT|nr:hypothetical protein CB0940_04287 [Cercospora beticola]PIA92616.1 hypothetical protein CB0940_04287 [Cercospora beticola]WPB01512.1 hypothetical protein RHO25_006138 [Cercospora beticola]